MNDYKKELLTAKGIAKEAGVIMLQYFDEDQNIEFKADNSPVTIADKLINSLVIQKLSIAFPDDGVIGEEESNTNYGDGRKWFCDPIDGTIAYVWGVPTAMFSLGLVVDGKPVIGVAYDPFLDKMYIGETGKKSFCNDKIISVSNLDMKSGILAVTSSIKSIRKTEYYQKMIDDNLRLASFSGAVYKSCLVAKGKFVGYIEKGVNAYDVAAVQVIIEGAGGKITSLENKELDYLKPFKGAIISNGIVHDEIIRYCS
ncbi:MAG: inositol monophosphatase [bacterium]|nr:inositol monophosphatase [bacterium]